jgi:hypothetical protein
VRHKSIINALGEIMLAMSHMSEIMAGGTYRVHSGPLTQCKPGVRGKPKRLKKKKVRNYFVYSK